MAARFCFVALMLRGTSAKGRCGASQWSLGKGPLASIVWLNSHGVSTLVELWRKDVSSRRGQLLSLARAETGIMGQGRPFWIRSFLFTIATDGRSVMTMAEGRRVLINTKHKKTRAPTVYTHGSSRTVRVLRVLNRDHASVEWVGLLLAALVR